MIRLRGRLFSMRAFLLILAILFLISSPKLIIIDPLLTFPIISGTAKCRFLFLLFFSLAFHDSSWSFAFQINFAIEIENL